MIEEAKTRSLKDFSAYAVGIFSASVCSVFSPEETTRRLNEEHPAGTERGWQPSKDEEFASGQPNPCPCNLSPERHKHYLFDC